MADYREVRIRLSDAEWAQMEEIRDEGKHGSVSALARALLKDLLRDDRLAQEEGCDA